MFVSRSTILQVLKRHSKTGSGWLALDFRYFRYAQGIEQLQLASTSTRMAVANPLRPGKSLALL